MKPGRKINVFAIIKTPYPYANQYHRNYLKGLQVGVRNGLPNSEVISIFYPNKTLMESDITELFTLINSLSPRLLLKIKMQCKKRTEPFRTESRTQEKQ